MASRGTTLMMQERKERAGADTTDFSSPQEREVRRSGEWQRQQAGVCWRSTALVIYFFSPSWAFPWLGVSSFPIIHREKDRSPLTDRRSLALY